MVYRTSDDLDAAIITLAAQAYDLAELDLDAPANSERLKAVALAILQRLDERKRLMTAPAIAV
ncbi:MAG TPA: hypothetical protein VK741_05690 [Acetobacteraceae bacterium]|jgi:hypothetical protein|nr:hypothetical protein [Acetobacteraceae bacterium]